MATSLVDSRSEREVGLTCSNAALSRTPGADVPLGSSGGANPLRHRPEPRRQVSSSN